MGPEREGLLRNPKGKRDKRGSAKTRAIRIETFKNICSVKERESINRQNLGMAIGFDD